MACTISFTRNVTRSCPRVTSTGNVLRPKFKANSQAEALWLCRLVRLPHLLAGSCPAVEWRWPTGGLLGPAQRDPAK